MGHMIYWVSLTRTDSNVARLKSLRTAVQDVDDYLLSTTLTSGQANELKHMKKSCESVIFDIGKIIRRNPELEQSHSLKKAWKRLKWDPDEVRGLRGRICSNTALLNGFFGRITQKNTLITRDHVLELAKQKTDELRHVCLDWMSSTSHAARQSHFIHERQPGTGGWLLECSEFQEWVKEPQATLFCPGAPGAGKTILASIVIDELKKRHGINCDVGIAYLFCSFQCQSEDQKPEALLASILRQLCQSLEPMPDSVVELYTKHKTEGTQPLLDEVSKALRAVIRQLSQTFIVLDALDECDMFSISRVLDEIFDIQSTTGNLSFLATSRKIPNITARFQGKASQEIRATKEDVKIYLSARLEVLQPSCELAKHPDLQQETLAILSEAIDGM